jgi:hypothetical protein
MRVGEEVWWGDSMMNYVKVVGDSVAIVVITAGHSMVSVRSDVVMIVCRTSIYNAYDYDY